MTTDTLTTDTLIDKAKAFYAAFGAGDVEKMVAFYADDVRFEDPAFGPLEGERARHMWRMLLKGKTPDLDVRDFVADGREVTLRWDAKYVFGARARPVHNKVEATLHFSEDGKIDKHTDVFDLPAWMGMALGTPGKIFGGFGIAHYMMRKGANAKLDKFIARR